MNRSVALVYVRVSRLDRDDRQKLSEGRSDELRALSPKTQLEQCRTLPALRGMTVEVFEDLHKSGKTTKRPGLERLLERAADPDVGIVCVWSISRLARSVPDLYELLERFQRVGVAFASAKESIDTSNAYGRAFLGFLAVLAQFERELTSERLAANLAQRAYDGHLVGPVPTGYVRDANGVVVVDEARASVVRALFEEYATGRHSFESLARWANAHGLTPPQHWRGKNGRRDTPLGHFTADSVGDLLCNMRYVGRFVHRARHNASGEVIHGKFPAIVSEELWARCEQVRRDARKILRGDKRVSRYPLTGLLVCGACGDNVRGDTTNYGRRRYLCRRQKEARLCDERQAPADALEADVLAWLRAVRVEPEWQEVYNAHRAALRAPQEAKTRPQRIRALEAKLERLRVSWEAGAYGDEAAYVREVRALRAEIDRLRSAPERSEERQTETIRTIADRWEEMRPDQRKRLLSTVFSELAMKDGRLESARPLEDWLPYFEHILRVPRVELRGIEPLTS